MILRSCCGRLLEGWSSVLSVTSVALKPTRPLVILKGLPGCHWRGGPLSSVYLQFETYKAAHHDLGELVWLSTGGAVLCPQCDSSFRPTRPLMILRSWSGCPQCTFSLRPARPLIILRSLSGCPLEEWTSVLGVPSVALGPTRPLVILCKRWPCRPVSPLS